MLLFIVVLRELFSSFASFINSLMGIPRETYSYGLVYSVDGKNYQATIPILENKFSVNDHIDIIYDPNNPDIAKIKGEENAISRDFRAELFVIGIIFIIYIFLIYDYLSCIDNILNGVSAKAIRCKEDRTDNSQTITWKYLVDDQEYFVEVTATIRLALTNDGFLHSYKLPNFPNHSFIFTCNRKNSFFSDIKELPIIYKKNNPKIVFVNSLEFESFIKNSK